MVNFLLSATLGFQGFWIKPCAQIEDDNWMFRELQIAESTWALKTKLNEESECSGPTYLSYEETWQASVQNDQVVLTSVSVTMTPESQETAEALNLMDYCGIHNWQAHQMQNISGKICQEQLAPPVGHVTTEAFRWDRDQLWLGNDKAPFIRQP